jgi:hypothetical protein
MACDLKLLRNGSSRVLYAIYSHGFRSATQSPFRQVDATNHHIIILQYSTIRKSLGIQCLKKLIKCFVLFDCLRNISRTRKDKNI